MDRLEKDRILEYLAQSGVYSLTLQVWSSTDSTQQRLLSLATEGAPNWTTVLADRQTLGRGRHGRTWWSPPGSNIYLSTLLPVPRGASDFPWIPLLVGVAVLESVHGSAVTVALKWPNDLIDSEGYKFAGILTEPVTRNGLGSVSTLAVGIGINVNCRVSDSVGASGWTSLWELTGQLWHRNRIVADLLRNLQQKWRLFQQLGFEPIRAAWEQGAAWLGQEVEVKYPNHRVRGRMLGIDAQGRLRLQTAAGERCLTSGEVSLRRSRGP